MAEQNTSQWVTKSSRAVQDPLKLQPLSRQCQLNPSIDWITRLVFDAQRSILPLYGMSNTKSSELLIRVVRSQCSAPGIIRNQYRSYSQSVCRIPVQSSLLFFLSPPRGLCHDLSPNTLLKLTESDFTINSLIQMNWFWRMDLLHSFPPAYIGSVTTHKLLNHYYGIGIMWNYFLIY